MRILILRHWDEIDLCYLNNPQQIQVAFGILIGKAEYLQMSDLVNYALEHLDSTSFKDLKILLSKFYLQDESYNSIQYGTRIYEDNL